MYTAWGYFTPNHDGVKWEGSAGMTWMAISA